MKNNGCSSDFRKYRIVCSAPFQALIFLCIFGFHPVSLIFGFHVFYWRHRIFSIFFKAKFLAIFTVCIVLIFIAYIYGFWYWIWSLLLLFLSDLSPSFSDCSICLFFICYSFFKMFLSWSYLLMFLHLSSYPIVCELIFLPLLCCLMFLSLLKSATFSFLIREPTNFMPCYHEQPYSLNW